MAKEITVIKKKVVTEEEQKQQVADELLNELSNNREAVEETMQLLAQLQKAGILDAAISLLAAKEDVSKIAVEQLNREPVKNALNNMMGAGEALSSVDPEITKQITSSLVTGLQFATDELNSGKKTKVMDFFKVLKDPDINSWARFDNNNDIDDLGVRHMYDLLERQEGWLISPAISLRTMRMRSSVFLALIMIGTITSITESMSWSGRTVRLY